jgi:hypothetical protein
VPLFDQPGDELDHLRDELARVRIVRGGPDVDARLVLHECVGVEGCDFLRRLFLQARGHEHLVLAPVERVIGKVADVGDVHHLLGFVAEVFERPPQQVGKHEGPQVSDVGIAIDGRAA